MNSFDILSPETVLSSRLFLEASAGTGKTFTIEHLVVRLLLETEMKLEEIVVVTFTRAATRELKERIRSNLERVVEKKGIPGSVEKVRFGLRQSPGIEIVGEGGCINSILPPSPTTQSRELSRQPKSDFFNRAGYKFPYLANMTKERLRKIECALKNFESAQIFTIHGFCHHLLKQFAFEAGISLGLSEWTREEEVWEIKQFLREQTVLGAGELHRLLSSYRFDMNRVEEALICSNVEKEPVSVAIPVLDVKQFDIAREFEEVRSSYKGMTSEEFSSQAVELEEAVRGGEIPPALWNKWVANPSFFLKNMYPQNLKVRAQSTCSSLMAEVRDAIVPSLERAQDPARIFKTLAYAWHAHRKLISEKEGKVTPDDLLKMVHAKLSIPAFTQAVRKKYHAAIVDEFQDTDPLQWEIFKTIFIEDTSKSVYLVGDPKQSIYAFRLADIYTFLDAGASFGLEQKAALTRNFRSTAGLLDQMNRLLCASAWMDLPKQNRSLEVPPALAAKEGAGHLCFMVAEGEKGRSSRFPTEAMEEEQFLPFIAQEIVGKKMEFGSTAILVKDRFQAERVKRFLDRHAIPAALYRSSPLNKSPVLEYVEEVLTLSVRKILLGPFAAIPYKDLTDEVVYAAKEKMRALAEMWHAEDFATFFAAFLNTRFGDKSALVTFHQQTDLLGDLLEITTKLLFAQSPPHLKELLEQIKLYETDDRISSHAHGVQIMTTHASKGLEFDNVFALGLASRTPPNEHPEELDAEKMRQFYVAVTRAVRQLYIPVARELPTATYALGEGSPVELFLAKSQPDLNSFTQEFLVGRTYNFERVSTPPPILTPPLPFQHPFPTRYLQSFTSLAQETPTLATGDDKGIDPGKETGLLFHRILERYFNREGALDTLVEEEAHTSKLAGKEKQIIQMLQSALHLPLGPFSLADISVAQTEVEFLYTTPQGWMRGFIDLLFEHEGKMYVVDWKTNLLENTESATLTNIMESHDYTLQGRIYKEAVQKFSPLPFGAAYFIFIRGPAYATIT